LKPFTPCKAIVVDVAAFRFVVLLLKLPAAAAAATATTTKSTTPQSVL